MITPGTSFGPYRIVAKLGVGGMGEVYRAKDTRLGREVAVKILPAEFADDPERLRRFEQEARSASLLNHPGILTVHDFGNEAGVAYLVTEVLEGESLRDRLQRGALPRREALALAAEIARALSAAHAKGVVHRDLKPENLFLTRDGRMKILDFGLAKLTLPNQGSRSLLAEATTLAEPTRGGMILGTVGYMAPEQVRGEPVDGRSDLFSFGCVLFEMLTGERAFQKAVVIETLSAILDADPVLALPRTGPTAHFPAVLRLLKRCLAKEPAERWQCAGDLATELEQLAQRPDPELEGSTTDVRPGVSRLLPTLALAALALAAGTGLGLVLRVGARTERGAPRPVTRFALEPPAGHTFGDYSYYGPPAVSPDGRSIVFLASDAAQSDLWLQRLDAVAANAIPNTAGAMFPFWSPDGAEIGFFADGKLKRVVLATGAVHVVCDASFSLGASWTDRGTILFAPAPLQPIWSVPALGGTPAPVTELAEGEFAHAWPEALPGGGRFLYQALTSDPEAPRASPSRRLRAATIDGENLEPGELVDSSLVRFVPPDRLVYVSGQALMARRFDPDSLRFEAEPAVLAEPVAQEVSRGDAPFGVGGDVVVVCSATERNALIWYDRRGDRLQTVAAPGSLWSLDLAADDATVLYSRINVATGTRGIWRADTRRGGEVPVTLGSDVSWDPVLSPDGRSMVFESDRLGLPELFVQELAPGSEARLLRHVAGLKYPVDWTPDGEQILLQYRSPTSPWEVWTIDADGEAAPVSLVAGMGETSRARVAPTGDLLAFSAKASDRWEIYIESYPHAGDRVRVSGEGGVQPTWRGDGAELYYLGLDSDLYAVPVMRRPRLDVGAPTRLFHVPVQGPLNIYQFYEPARDGQRFLVNALVEGRGASSQVILGWQSLLADR